MKETGEKGQRQPDTEILLEKVERLAGLLRDPDPGLFTWMTAYYQALEAVAEWSPNYQEEKGEPNQ